MSALRTLHGGTLHSVLRTGYSVLGTRYWVLTTPVPCAQKRFCSAEHISNMQTLSDVHNKSFGEHYGVLIEGLPIPLLSRAIFVIDKGGKITYCEYVPEVTEHPNYDKALEALKAAA